MYITDLTHFLDGSGAIAPIKGAARAMAQFLVDVVAHAGVVVLFVQIGAHSPEPQHPCGFPCDASAPKGRSH